MAITSNPIPEPIQKSTLSVGLQEIVKIPNSNNNAPRLNYITSANDGSGRLFVNDMRGKLYVINNGVASVYLDLKAKIGTNFLDSSGQQGFISFAFDPDFETNGIFYTVHSERKGTSIPDFPITKPIYDNKGNLKASSHHDVITKWQVNDSSANIFSGTSTEILRIEEPFSDHNVGQIAFNPNAKPGDADYGMLYMGIADGGSNGFPVSDTDPLDNGQDLSVPLGKILRINPKGNNSANGKYGIPSDNPFANDSNANTLGEIWAYGLRNPHRISWDTGSDGKMLIADIGQFFIEEVNLGIKGANYGWGNREGTFVTDENNEYVVYELPENDADFGYTYPVAAYDHDVTGLVAIAGGYVYRGTEIPELVGQYITADFANDGRFFHVSSNQLINGQQANFSELRLFNGSQETSFLSLLNKTRSDVRFGVGEDGEIYVTNKQDGIIRKLVRSPEFITPNPEGPINTGFYISDVNVVEGTSNTLSAIFTVSLTQATNASVAVDYATADGLAKAGEDYIATNGTLTFLPGETSKTISVSIINDNSNENEEFLTVQLTNPENALLTQPIGTATISDTLLSSVSYTLPAGVENLTLTGTSNTTGNGNSNNNILIGNNGNNNLDGKAGVDTLIGGLGNDYYYVDNTGDKIIEDFGQGNDVVRASINFILPDNVETVTLTGTANLTATGNSLNNRLNGNTGNNTLYGDEGNDYLNGNVGLDTMQGGLGNDYYYVDNIGDQVIENFGEGSDTVESTISYILPDNLENLTLTGTANLDGTGNNLNNRLYGNTGNNILEGKEGNDYLNGKAGLDTMKGGLGNDYYYVDNIEDQVIEIAGEGSDTVESIISYILPDNLENLTLTGTANLDGTGNSLNNRINGNTGNNTLEGNQGNDYLNGRGGGDTMKGGLGNDYYYVDNSGDRVVEIAGEGSDTVESTITYTLTQNVEHLVLKGADNIDGTGNTLYNRLTGNDGNNKLTGGDGNDTLNGGNGNDVLVGGNGNDNLTGGTGNDSFLFNAKSEAIDTIADFSTTDDIIQIKISGFGGGLTEGLLSEDKFVLGSSAADNNDRFIYQQSTGKLLFDVDGTGSIASMQLATLSNKVNLSFNNIAIIA